MSCHPVDEEGIETTELSLVEIAVDGCHFTFTLAKTNMEGESCGRADTAAFWVWLCFCDPKGHIVYYIVNKLCQQASSSNDDYYEHWNCSLFSMNSTHASLQLHVTQ